MQHEPRDKIAIPLVILSQDLPATKKVVNELWNAFFPIDETLQDATKRESIVPTCITGKQISETVIMFNCI
jgi:hypothetical protein